MRSLIELEIYQDNMILVPEEDTCKGSTSSSMRSKLKELYMYDKTTSAKVVTSFCLVCGEDVGINEMMF